MHTRKYIPAIGKLVKLKSWDDYRALELQCNWDWFTVREHRSASIVLLELYNGGDTGMFFDCPLHRIAEPVGWEPRYTITVGPDKVDTVLSWFKRGMVARLSHNLNPHYMPMVWQPLDNSAQPGWQFPEVTDVIQPEDCAKLIKLVKIEDEEINFVPDPDCKWCAGTGRRNIASLMSARGEDYETVHRAIIDGRIQIEQYDEKAATYRCPCHPAGFRSLGRTKRAKLVKAWEADGWKVSYAGVGANGYWHRTRETVVHDWE